jgi:hypothetical protein
VSIDTAKRTVQVDIDGLMLWLPGHLQEMGERLRQADRIEFDHSYAVNKRPPPDYEWMGQIWCCSEPEFGLKVPLRFLTFDKS